MHRLGFAATACTQVFSIMAGPYGNRRLSRSSVTKCGGRGSTPLGPQANEN